MAYVDLNPVRAGIADSIDSSEYTSAYERINGKSSHEDTVKTDKNGFKFRPLMGFIGDEHQEQTKGIGFNLIGYLELLDWTGRVIREDKYGAISTTEPNYAKPVLIARLGSTSPNFGKQQLIAVGTLEELASFAAHTEHKWMGGERN